VCSAASVDVDVAASTFAFEFKSRCGHTFKWLANIVVVVAIIIIVAAAVAAASRTRQTIAPLTLNTLTIPTTFVQRCARVYVCV